MSKLTETQKAQYLNAISEEVFHKPYTDLTAHEKVTLSVNLIVRLSTDEFTEDEYTQLREANIIINTNPKNPL